MSASDGNQANSHADDHAEAKDHGPAASPEPNTPMWLPAVGALLFLTAGLAWALSAPPKDTTDLSAIPAGSASGAPTANGAPAPTQTNPAPAATPAPTPAVTIAQPIGQPRQINGVPQRPLPPGDKRRK